jgi:hypothetical protein
MSTLPASVDRSVDSFEPRHSLVKEHQHLAMQSACANH